MSKFERKFDLEERTEVFARSVFRFTKKLPNSRSNLEVVKQMIRSAGSVGANYIEANEALSKKDFIYRIKICRKEAKEAAYWIRLLDITKEQFYERNKLLMKRMSL